MVRAIARSRGGSCGGRRAAVAAAGPARGDRKAERRGGLDRRARVLLHRPRYARVPHRRSASQRVQRLLLQSEAVRAVPRLEPLLCVRVARSGESLELDCGMRGSYEPRAQAADAIMLHDSFFVVLVCLRLAFASQGVEASAQRARCNATRVCEPMCERLPRGVAPPLLLLLACSPCAHRIARTGDAVRATSEFSQFVARSCSCFVQGASRRTQRRYAHLLVGRFCAFRSFWSVGISFRLQVSLGGGGTKCKGSLRRHLPWTPAALGESHVFRRRSACRPTPCTTCASARCACTRTPTAPRRSSPEAPKASSRTAALRAPLPDARGSEGAHMCPESCESSSRVLAPGVPGVCAGACQHRARVVAGRALWPLGPHRPAR